MKDKGSDSNLGILSTSNDVALTWLKRVVKKELVGAVNIPGLSQTLVASTIRTVRLRALFFEPYACVRH